MHLVSSMATCPECGLVMPVVDQAPAHVAACCNVDCRSFHKLMRGSATATRSAGRRIVSAGARSGAAVRR